MNHKDVVEVASLRLIHNWMMQAGAVEVKAGHPGEAVASMQPPHRRVGRVGRRSTAPTLQRGPANLLGFWIQGARKIKMIQDDYGITNYS